jgi:hypothetical protein
MTETTNPYRAYLEELASSRGLSGAEELAERTHEADPHFTVREILENPGGGFGQPLDAVLGMTEEEKGGLSSAWQETFISPRRDEADRA